MADERLAPALAGSQSGRAWRTTASTRNATPLNARLASTIRLISRNAESAIAVRRWRLRRRNSAPGATSRKKKRTESQVLGTTG